MLGCAHVEACARGAEVGPALRHRRGGFPSSRAAPGLTGSCRGRLPTGPTVALPWCLLPAVLPHQLLPVPSPVGTVRQVRLVEEVHGWSACAGWEAAAVLTALVLFLRHRSFAGAVLRGTEWP